jgi:hypothetical protein
MENEWARLSWSIEDGLKGLNTYSVIAQSLAICILCFVAFSNDRDSFYCVLLSTANI